MTAVVSAYQGTELQSSYFEPGTRQYYDTLSTDYMHGLLTEEQYIARQSLQPGQALTPAMTGESAGPSGFTSFLTGLTSIADTAFRYAGKYQTLENQREMTELAILAERQRIERGMMGEGVTPSYGGLNLYTLIFLGGVAIMAMILLKKP